MNTVIYSSNPLWIFASTLAGLGIMPALGVAALVFAVFRGKEKKLTRIFMAFLGLFLCVMGALGLGFTALSLLTGAQTVAVRLADKTAAHDNCGENGSTCTRYILETTAGPRSYDFTVEQSAFNAAEQGACYRVTYYPNRGLFASNYGTDLYVASSYVTRLEHLPASDCP